ncbi:MAG TPA: DUF4830 domain-containing protein [Clostridiales bacterium]|nr:DUF4830 domain-containing protein [Clostridiales bacterium]
MFIKTVRLSRKKAVLIILAVAVLLMAIVLIAGSDGADGTEAYRLKLIGGVKTHEDRVRFLEELGWIVEKEPIEEKSILIPKEFSNVYAEYNELQKQQGYDLSQYCGLEVMLYIYRVANYPNATGEVLACLYVYNNQVIGGDIHSTALDGFMHGLK